MNIKTWLWCLSCERTFSVMMSGEADINDARFFAELEMQLGVEQDGEVYAECPYDDCTGGPLGFNDWDSFRTGRENLPEVPEEGIEYPLYHDDE